MGTVMDSGNETLFSDDSSCDLQETSSTSACSSNAPGTELHDSSKCIAPPKILPYSGVLAKGKVVIRPIAFKPVCMTPSVRFGNSGERYGSTPILPRASSHIALYGSNTDLRHHGNLNYSLDRKLLSSCTSTSSSPPLGMASLSSLPVLSSGRKMNYDSLESVRKSPTSTLNGHVNRNKLSFGLLSNASGCSMIDLTPSPSDSGISELEAALRDRDSELAYLRQTMEHNEQVIFRVYQEKERVWERELRRMKSVHENRLRASAQKAHKLEQMLMMQTYQLQQDKKRLCSENERLSQESVDIRQDINLLRSRLEETEWGLCQKTGEISLLKSQLKDAQSENTTRGHELLQLRSEYREVKDNLNKRTDEIDKLNQNVTKKDMEIRRLQEEIHRLTKQLQKIDVSFNTCQNIQLNVTENERIKSEPRELCENLSEADKSDNDDIESNKSLHMFHITQNYFEIYGTNLSKEYETPKLNENICTILQTQYPEVTDYINKINSKMREFEKERITWVEEKAKVLKYQKQLQLNYVQMYRRTRALEAEIENLTLEMKYGGESVNQKLPTLDLRQPVEM